METVTACVKRDYACVVLRDGERAPLHGWRRFAAGEGTGGRGQLGPRPRKGQTVGAFKPS